MPLSKFTPISPFKPHEVGPCFLVVMDRISSHTTFAFKLYTEHIDRFIGILLGVKITAENAC